MCETLGSDIQALTKVIAVKRVDLQDDVPTDQAPSAVELREITHLPLRFSFALLHALSRHTHHQLQRQGATSVKAAQPPTGHEAAEAPWGPTPEKLSRDNDGDMETRKS